VRGPAMIDDAWLGFYTNGADAFEEGRSRLHLFVSSSGGLHFEYCYELRSNHGYDVSFQEGIVTSRAGDELSLRFAFREASSWEDMFKEHQVERSTAPATGVIQIEHAGRDTPIMIYAA